MSQKITLHQLWQSVLPGQTPFQPESLSSLPEIAQRYLNHAIAPGTRLATAVQLQMHGEIKLKGWVPFTAKQVICQHRGLIWQATTWMNGLPIWGSDRLVDGAGAMQWKLLGLIPVMVASGPDITRSGTGRFQGESVWLPSAFCQEQVAWTGSDTQAIASMTVLNERTDLKLAVTQQGQLETLQFQRWGNPAGGAFSYENFGGYVEEEKPFSGYTIPTRLRLGWYFGSDRYEMEGEFFRVTIDDAIYR